MARFKSAPSRGGSLAQISSNTFKQLEDFVEDNNRSTHAIWQADEAFAQMLARVSQSYAHRYSAGMMRKGANQRAGQWVGGKGIRGQMILGTRTGGHRDRTLKNPAGAWRFPVPRITEEYHKGWQVKKVGHGIWTMFNLVRHAYFVEYGIHTSTRRVRRPVLKKSTLSTLQMVWYSSRTIQRFADSVFSQAMRSGTQTPRFDPFISSR